MKSLKLSTLSEALQRQIQAELNQDRSVLAENYDAEIDLTLTVKAKVQLKQLSDGSTQVFLSYKEERESLQDKILERIKIQLEKAIKESPSLEEADFISSLKVIKFSEDTHVDFPQVLKSN